MIQEKSTICALATCPMPSGIAVVRISGNKTKESLSTIFSSEISPLENPRKMLVGEIIVPQTTTVIDQALAVFFPAPNSYTGEDLAELHCHGNPLIAAKVIQALGELNIIPAAPGEFTKRAFENGKIDLAQAEAIAELISATSDNALKIAQEHLSGRFSQGVLGIAEPLRNCLAEIEAWIDFPEEEIPQKTLQFLLDTLDQVETGLRELLDTYHYGQLITHGLRVLLTGKPNVGKSSILNLLLGRQRAIVSAVSGTTRDLLEESVTIDGCTCIFCDSAGISNTQDEVEKLGIELAKERMGWADLVLFVVDSNEDLRHAAAALNEVKRLAAAPIWLLINKIDLNRDPISVPAGFQTAVKKTLTISAVTKEGLDDLKRELIAFINVQKANHAEGNAILSNARQLYCVKQALEFLISTRQLVGHNAPLEILTVELRAILKALEEIIGKTYTEDILGRIFSKFCIGK